MEEKETAQLPVSPQEVQLEVPSFLDKLKIHKVKILVVILGVLVLAGAVFGVYKFGQKLSQPGPPPTPTPLPSEVPAKEGDPTANWKTYRLEKSYKNSELKFEIRHPQEWQVLEESESVKWYTQDPKEYLFFVSWLNPDVIYGVEGLCRPGMCDRISEFKTRNGVNIEIWKPTQRRREYLSLTDEYLQASISNFKEFAVQRIMVPEFGTPSLKLEFFKNVLSTFKFLPSTSSGQGE